MPPLKVTLCLGSSCHSRGNRRQVETLRQALATRAPEVEFELRGSLCLGRCAEGPVVLFDGEPRILGPGEDLASAVLDRLAVRAGS